MTRICLLVEIDTEDQVFKGETRTPQALRHEVEVLLLENYWRPTVELTALESAHEGDYVNTAKSWLPEARAALYTITPVEEIFGPFHLAPGLNGPLEVFPEVNFDLEIYKITTGASNYEIMMNDDGSGTITRIGGSSPYVPPDVSSRPWDGQSFTFTNGRFSDHSPDGSYQGGESFWCDGCELLYHTGWIVKKEQVA